MELQQQFGQRMQRRCQREKEREQAGLEGDQAPDREAPWKPAVKPPPAAQIDASRKQQRNYDPGLKRPRLKYAEAITESGRVFSISNCGPWLISLTELEMLE